MGDVPQYSIKKINTADEIASMMAQIPDMVARLEKRTDPAEHYKKLAAHAENFILFSEDEACAYAAIYANDMKEQVAFITFIGCIPSKRHMGYGQILYDYVCDYARTKKMKVLRLEVAIDNVNAMGFYKKNGMHEVGKTKHGLIMEKRL